MEPTPELTISTTSLQSVSQYDSYSAEITASGGSGVDYRWSITEGGLPPGVVLISEQTPSTLITGRPQAGGTYSFTVRVLDSEGNTATQELSLVVEDAPAKVSITTAALPNGVVGMTYSATVAAENGSGYSWRLLSGQLPPGLELASSGTPATTLAGTPSAEGNYTFTLEVSDANGDKSSMQYSVEITTTIVALELLRQTLDGGTVSLPYSATIVARNGSNQGYEWSLYSGTLPPGLTLTATGTPSTMISGTPTTEGSYSFRLQVRDSSGRTDRESFTIAVAAAPQRLRIQTRELPTGRVNVAYSQAVLAAFGTGANYAWSVLPSAAALPPGLSLSGGTPSATLLGTPTTAGTYTFTVMVSDASGSAEQQLTVRVEPPIETLVITATAATNGVLVLADAVGGQPYSATLSATGGATLPANAAADEVRYNWVVSGGSIPPGLTLDPIGRGANYDGTFTGVPSALGTYTATVTVYDRDNRTATQVIQITVQPPSTPLAISATGLDPLASSGCYSTTLSAAGGGNAGFTWRVVSGTLPTGYSLASSGTPSTVISTDNASSAAPGTYPVVIEVTDSFGLTATRTVNFVVSASKAGSPRFAFIVGDGESNSRYDIYAVGLCGASGPEAPVRISPTGSGSGISSYSSYFRVVPSPSGDAIAFIANIQTSGVDDVYVVDLRGTPTAGSATRVYTGASTSLEAYAVRWSPDGSKLAIMADHVDSADYGLWVADISDLSNPGTAVRVSQTPSGGMGIYSSYYQFVFSPDSTKIAYNADLAVASRQEMWVVDLSGSTPSAPQRLHAPFSSSSMDVNYGPMWTPDSRGVVFNGDLRTASKDELFFTDVSGPGPYTEVAISGSVQSSGDIDYNLYGRINIDFGFSPDGTKMFFIGDATTEGADNVYLLDYANGTFSNRRNLTGSTTSGLSALAAKFSPDSSKLLVHGDLRASGADELFVYDLSGTPSFPMTRPAPLLQGSSSNETYYYYSRGYWVWTPDSSKVVFMGDYDTASIEELWVADLSTTPVTTTKINQDISGSTARDVTGFRLSPNGDRLAYLSDGNVSSAHELFVSELSGTTPTQGVRVHGALTTSATSIGTQYSIYGVDDEWHWTDNDGLIFAGDIETGGEDRVWFVDLTAPSPMPTDITGSTLFNTSSLDAFVVFVRDGGWYRVSPAAND